jgi:hypothetical protein
MYDVAKLIGGEIEESEAMVNILGSWSGSSGFVLVKVDTTVAELAEGSLLLDLCSTR